MKTELHIKRLTLAGGLLIVISAPMHFILPEQRPIVFAGCCHVNSPNLQVGKLFVDQAACAADFHASNASSRW
ncbi:MAG: hypothetical protein ABJK67_13485 [Anderseniella sp.]